MNYLELLKKDKQNREKFEQEAIKFKEIITEQETLYSLYDGEFLNELIIFINNYKNSKNAQQN